MVDVAAVRAERDRVGALLRALEPDAVALTDAEPMWDAFDRIERHAANAKTLLARRVEEAATWRRRGHRDAAEGMAKKSGTTRGAAKQQLQLSKKLDEHPATEIAMRKGEISPIQAGIVAAGANGDRAAEKRLLDKAMTSTVAALRQEAARERANADPDPEGTERRIHAERRVRMWTDDEDRWHFNATGTVRDGSHVARLLERLVNEEFTKARNEGRREEREAYAFDAFIGVFRDYDQRNSEEDESDEKPKKKRHRCPSHLSILRLDYMAMWHGYVEGDELCEIAGVGPVPVKTARALLGESILKLVVTKGEDVVNVTHLGRGPKVAQKIALLWQSPCCTAEGCTRTRIEFDHREPWAETKHTRLDELDALCTFHHDLKHRDEWSLVEGTGKRPMVPPYHPSHPKNRPKAGSG
ncbi:MAG TPA: DUF222 domain-containing protein [Acidimicrobiia bacterium]|nr:DUF222 domain-containing protein [Acidimicrobiia bacterium]